MNSQSGLYVFQTIPGEDWIRVLDLEPASSQDADLRVSLREVRIADGPAYEAISYSWGQPVFPTHLHIRESYLDITENLADALRHFRVSSKTRTLWADSVCINQQDDKEKSHQVGMMHEIYKNASNVLIWLGKKSSDTTEAFRFVRRLRKKYNFERFINQTMDVYMWRTLPTLNADVSDQQAEEIVTWSKKAKFKDIYTRDWFTRLWTVQEVAIASRRFTAVVHCGIYELKWGWLGDALEILMAAANRLGVELENMEAFQRAYTINEVQHHYGYVEEVPMTLIMDAYQHFGIYVEKLRNQKCSDDRDRVYALLGLRPSFFGATQSQDPNTVYGMKPDYTIPALELYRKFTLAMVISGDFDFLLNSGLWQRYVKIFTQGMLFVSGREKVTKGHWFTEEDLETIDDPVPEGMEHNFTRNLPGQSSLGKPSILYVEPAIPDLPSWSLDLSNSRREPYTLPWLNTHGEKWFHAGGGMNPMSASSTLPGHLTYLEDDLDENGNPDSIRRIFLSGKLVDQVQSMGIIHQWESHLPGSRLCYLRSLALVCRQIFGIAVENCQGQWSLPEDPEMTFARTIVAEGSGSVFRSLMKDCIVEGEVDHGKLLFYWNTYDKYWQDKDLDTLQDYHSFDDIPSPSTTPEDLEVVKLYHRCLIESLEGHIFFCTKDRNLLGLAPLLSKSNDNVAVIAGVRTPLVLRPGTDSTGKSGYLIVGPCYLSGVMDGSEVTIPNDLKGQEIWDYFTSIPLI